MNLSEMITLFRIYVDDPRAKRWTQQSEISELLSGAQEEAEKIIDSADEGYFRGCVTYSVTPTPNNSLEFELPTDFKRVIIAERLFTDAAPLAATWTVFQRRHEDYDWEWTFDGHRARPLLYLSGTKLGVVNPNTTYTLQVFYNRRLARFLDLADISEVPAEYHKWIVLRAAKMAFAAEDRKFPAEFTSEYELESSRLLAFIEERQRQTPRYVHFVPE